MRKIFPSIIILLFLQIVNAQNTPPSGEMITLKGVVVDNAGVPLAVAGVKVVSSSKGTATDFDGNFSIQLPKNKKSELIFSYIGMQTKRYVFDGKTTFVKIILKEDISQLEEVVVIGYGEKSKQNLTSSVSSINANNIEKISRSGNTIDNVLGGAIKGVLVNQSSGEPGATASINIRGLTSPFPNLTSSQANNIPLFIIDGVPTFVGSNALNPLSTIAPEDIKSIDVLKDASATAIYGSRGANGVIIINTISGTRNKPLSVNVKYSLSISNPIKQYKPLNREQFISLQDEIIKNSIEATNTGASILGYFPDIIDKWANVDVDPVTFQYIYKGLKKDAFGNYETNWEKEIQNVNAPTQEIYSSITGGSEKINYAFSINALEQEGLLINDKLNRYNSRLALGVDLSKNITVGVNASYTYSKRNSSSERKELSNNLTPPWSIRPDIPVYTDKKYTIINSKALGNGLDYFLPNPVAKRQRKADFIVQQLSGNAYVDIALIDNLKLHGDINFSNYQYDNKYFTPIETLELPTGAPKIATLDVSDTSVFRSSANLRLDYGISMENHNLDFMVGVGRDFSKREFTSYYFQGLPLTNIGSAQKLFLYDGNASENALASVYGRFSYNYKEKYLTELSMRGDKSSKFGPNNRWGYFPAVSAGWVINRENFMKDIISVDNLKLRLSWGQTGSTNIPDFSYVQHFVSGKNDLYGNHPFVGMNDVLPNKDVRWEVTTEVNAGIDFSFFAHRFYGSIDVYSRYTDGALAPAPHISESGLPSYYANIIDTSNKGIEFQIGGDIIRKSDFSWNTDFNLSFNRNKIEKLNSASINPYMQEAFIEGYPAGTARGYIVEKIIQNQAEIDKLNAEAIAKGFLTYQQQTTGVGDYLMKDTNKDGRIDVDDRQVIANPEADFFGGWTNTFTYKNVSLSIFCQFLKGGDIIWEPIQTSLSGNIGFSVIPEVYGKTWTPERTDAQYPRLIGFTENYFNSTTSNRMVFDASYFRVKNIVLEYTFPQEIYSNLHVKDLSLSLSASNPFTFTKWPGLDPETTGTLIISKSTNSDTYPTNKSLTLGIKASF